MIISLKVVEPGRSWHSKIPFPYCMPQSAHNASQNLSVWVETEFTITVIKYASGGWFDYLAGYTIRSQKVLSISQATVCSKPVSKASGCPYILSVNVVNFKSFHWRISFLEVQNGWQPMFGIVVQQFAVRAVNTRFLSAFNMIATIPLRYDQISFAVLNPLNGQLTQFVSATGATAKARLGGRLPIGLPAHSPVGTWATPPARSNAWWLGRRMKSLLVANLRITSAILINDPSHEAPVIVLIVQPNFKPLTGKRFVPTSQPQNLHKLVFVRKF